MTILADIEGKIIELFWSYNIEIEHYPPNIVRFYFNKNLSEKDYLEKIGECTAQYPDINPFVDKMENHYALTLNGLHIDELQKKAESKHISSSKEKPRNKKRRR